MSNKLVCASGRSMANTCCSVWSKGHLLYRHCVAAQTTRLVIACVMPYFRVPSAKLTNFANWANFSTDAEESRGVAPRFLVRLSVT